MTTPRSRLARFSTLPALALIAVCVAGCSESELGEPQVTRKMLDESLVKGRDYLMATQTDAGNFIYEVDFLSGKETEDDMSARQAGGLWALTSLHDVDPSDKSREAVERGIAFFIKYSETNEKGRYTAYPNKKYGMTNAQAILCLAIMQFLETEPEHPKAAEYRERLDEFLTYLASLRMEDGRFHSRFSKADGKPTKGPSPYADGEALLALTRASLQFKDDSRKKEILDSAEAMFNIWFKDSKKKTHQFYQWGSMAYLDLYKTKWPGSKQYAERTIKMALWRIGKLPKNPKYNMATAYEGLVPAWQLAKLTDEKACQKRIGRQIDRGLYDLLAWQVGGPRQNAYLKKNKPKNDKYVGGVLSHRDGPLLRVDYTQHQMNAMYMARKYVYAEE